VRKNISLYLWTLGLLLAGVPLLGAEAPVIEAPAQKVVPPTRDNTANEGPTTPSRVLPTEHATYKNYLNPALEIPTFIFVLNQADRLNLSEEDTFDTTFGSGWNHVTHGHWVVDQDDFVVNQIGHPYQGTIYYATARSSGLNFWESWLYSNAGSYLWETYGENSDPSINDQIASGTGGALLGEPLYRLCNLIMSGGHGRPGFFRTLSATIVSPPTMINRWLFGPKYGPTLEDRDPPLFMRVDVGAGRNDLIREPRNAQPVSHTVGMAKFSLDYGSPGDENYRYQRPFDYFHMDAAALANHRNVFDDLSVRGLLFGAPYTGGEQDTVHGIWGMYGHFDYESPQIFRFGSTAVSFGTTSQIDLKHHIALLGTALVGVGYASAGTITPTDSQDDFHYGVTPQGTLALRLILGSRLSLDASGHTYYITDNYASRAPGTEHIDRLDTSLLFRLFGGHSISCGYSYLQREARYHALPSLSQRIGTVNVMYSYVTDMHLGRVNPEN
jgi:hypothetical protein